MHRLSHRYRKAITANGEWGQWTAIFYGSPGLNQFHASVVEIH